MSAPARRIDGSVSMIAGSRAIQPLAAAASTMAYSPETLYAATGTSTTSRTGDHVEVGQGRLDHHHVCALGDVEQRLPHSFDGVGGVLLVGASVALEGGGDGLAERPVENITHLPYGMVSKRPQIDAQEDGPRGLEAGKLLRPLVE